MSRGPEFNSQQPYDGSQTSVQAVQLQCTHIHKINKSFFKNGASTILRALNE